MPISVEDFLQSVPAEHQKFVADLDQKLTEKGCKIKIKEAKSGYAVSYLWNDKTIMNWVFRKAGIVARIYGDNAKNYESLLEQVPAGMQKKMTGARDCKRLKDPGSCSSTCVMGMVYDLDGETQKKCRNDGMMFLLDQETAPYIEKIVLAELEVRQES